MRLFLGLPVPGADALADASARLKAAHPDLRLVPAGTWHATIRFLGDVTSDDARDRLIASLGDVLRGARPIPVRVAGLGAFPDPSKATVVWAGIEAPGIKRLVERVNTATALFGKAPDTRPYHAHVTLGRMRLGGDFSRDVHAARDTVFGTGVLDEVVLWQSTLTQAGPVYEPLQVFPLS